MQGRFDSPLTRLGVRQAETNGRFLASCGIESIWASPLGRVRKTLGIMSDQLSAPTTFDERLTEWDSGEWSSHLYSDLHWRWPREFAEWEEDRYWVRPPKGENYPDMMKRAKAVLEEIQADPAPTVAIVSHGMIARAILGVLLKLPEKDVLKIRQRNDVIVRVDLSEAPSASHYIGGDGPVWHLPTGHTRIKKPRRPV